jgi:dTDP-4-dehydrorhamnose reductase
VRVWLTGGTGFVGSNIVHVALQRGDEVMTTVHRFRPEAGVGYQTDHVNMTDQAAVRASIERFGPGVVVHCAILNDFAALYRDRKAAWDAYVTATATTAAAARSVGAPYVVVSTDWVFDGTQRGADEDTPPNPINFYGVLKLASELVALERGGAVARISGVNGLHRARPDSPRQQDPGFGYFVASLVESLGRGEPFTVWEADNINMVATPSLASDSADLILRIGDRGLTGVFHCCGRDAMSRMELARMACEVFELEPGLLRSGPPDPRAMPAAPIPYDTSITAPRTSRLLDHDPASVRELLMRFRDEYESAAG